MLLKLLKYEYKSSYARFILAFLVYILSVSVLMLFFRKHDILNIAFLIFGIIALYVITFFTIFQRYNSNLYRNEGHLMFTLPISGKTLLLSKIIGALILMFVFALVIVPSILIVIYCYSDAEFINESIKFIKTNLMYCIIFVIEYILAIIRSIIVIYFSISVSKLPIWRRFGVLSGFITYFLVELLDAVPVLLLRNMTNHFAASNGAKNILSQYSFNDLLIQCFFDLFIFVALFFATSYLLENRTSLK
jgi:hypothetical protein